MLTSYHRTILSLPVLLAGLLLAGIPVRAGVPLPDGALLNLCTLRGAKTSASANCITPTEWPLHPVHTVEMRFQCNFGPAWWMVELPGTFQLASHRIGYRDPMVSMGYQIKISATPLTDAQWAAKKPVFEFKGPLATGQEDGLCAKWSSGAFTPVAARFVRIEWLGHNGGETGGPGQGHADLIVGKIQLYGPNKLDLTPMVSMAQSAWAGGEVTLAEANGGGSAPGVNDDSEPKARGCGYLCSSFVTNPGNADPDKLPGKSAEYVVQLKYPSMVEAVAYASMNPQRKDRPKDMRIYTSLYTIGDQWVLQKELREIPGGVYEEIKFDAPVLARRVKFQIPRVWAENGDHSMRPTSGYMAELYVYGTARPRTLSINLKQGGMTTATIVDGKGATVRTLWTLENLKPGLHISDWDGLSDDFTEAPPGKYTLRVMVNSGLYRNVAAVGNTGMPPNPDGHCPAGIDSITIDDQDNVYSVNGWDEAGHDWQKWDKDGHTLMDSKFQIRNGNPNGLPYRVAVDDHYFYCAYISHNGDGKVGSQYIERFDRETGKAVKFAKGLERNGLIQVYPAPEKDEWRHPVSDLVVIKDRLYAGDSLAQKVLVYDKDSGEKLNEFAVTKPGSMAADSQGRLWIVQDDTAPASADTAPPPAFSVVVYDTDGKLLGKPITTAWKIVGLAFGPGSTLYAANGTNERVEIYDVHDLDTTLRTRFGQPAKPGDSRPDLFYGLHTLSVGKDGLLVTVDRFPLGGSRMVKWTADMKPLWQQMGLEFTGNATYQSTDPDTLVSYYFQRYRLNKKTGGWAFDGNLYTGGVKNQEWHGTPRWATIGGKRFFYLAIGDGMYVFRLDGSALHHVASLGGNFPNEKGENKQSGPLGQWTWTDANGNYTEDDDEINWYKESGKGQYYVFGMNVDSRGDILYCDHITKSAWMIPVHALNKSGNPVYDWADKKEIIPADTTKVGFQPLMAVRTDLDTVYAFGRSTLYPPDPDAGPAWMSGWVLAKFDKTGKRIWVRRLPHHVTGMDYIPGPKGTGDSGVMVGWYARSIIYHYTADGLLVGMMSPGEAAGGFSGWLDNTSSVAVNRDPRDGLIDVFVEEDYAHRILWYRVDDTKITVQEQAFVRG